MPECVQVRAIQLARQVDFSTNRRRAGHGGYARAVKKVERKPWCQPQAVWAVEEVLPDQTGEQFQFVDLQFVVVLAVQVGVEGTGVLKQALCA